jgi:hypothetical protein
MMSATLGFLLLLALVSVVTAVLLRRSSVNMHFGMIKNMYKAGNEYAKDRELQMLKKSLIY